MASQRVGPYAFLVRTRDGARPVSRASMPRVRSSLAPHPLRFGAQLVAEIRVRHCDEFVGAVANRFSFEPRDSVLSHNIMYEGAWRGDDATRRQTRHNARETLSLHHRS